MDQHERPAPQSPSWLSQCLGWLKRRLRDWRQSLLLNMNFARRRRIVRAYQRCQSVDDIVAFTKRYLDTGICQKPSEIKAALDAMISAAPRSVCEIGTATGGNTLLLSMIPTADLMIGLDLYVRNKAYLRLLRRPAQRLYLVDGSSYAPSTEDRVRRILHGRTIDVLFIDGDHRYEGVANDFLRYRHLVSEGGLVLFHDIMPDQGDEWLWAGGVPIFWQKVKHLYPSQEFVEDPQQKAFGIGLIRYSSTVELPPGLEASSCNK